MNPKITAELRANAPAASSLAPQLWVNAGAWEFWLDDSLGWWSVRLRHIEDFPSYMSVALHAFGGPGLVLAAARMAIAITSRPLPYLTPASVRASIPAANAKQLLGAYVAWLLLEEE